MQQNEARQFLMFLNLLLVFLQFRCIQTFSGADVFWGILLSLGIHRVWIAALLGIINGEEFKSHLGDAASTKLLLPAGLAHLFSLLKVVVDLLQKYASM